MTEFKKSVTWKMFLDLFPIFFRRMTAAIPEECVKVEGNTITVAPSNQTCLTCCVEDWEYSAILSTEDGDEDVFSTLNSDPHKVIEVLVAALKDGEREKEEKQKLNQEKLHREEIAKTFLALGFRQVDAAWATTSITLSKELAPDLLPVRVIITKDLVTFSWGGSVYKPALTLERSAMSPWDSSDVRHHILKFMENIKGHLLKSLNDSFQ